MRVFCASNELFPQSDHFYLWLYDSILHDDLPVIFGSSFFFSSHNTVNLLYIIRVFAEIQPSKVLLKWCYGQRFDLSPWWPCFFGEWFVQQLSGICFTGGTEELAREQALSARWETPSNLMLFLVMYSIHNIARDPDLYWSMLCWFKPELVSKITGMLLELDNSEVVALLCSSEMLSAKVDECVQLLHATKTKTEDQDALHLGLMESAGVNANWSLAACFVW